MWGHTFLANIGLKDLADNWKNVYLCQTTYLIFKTSIKKV